MGAAKPQQYARPRFRSTSSFVAVKPIYQTATSAIAVGEPVTGYRLRGLLRLWRGGYIGPVGDPWTDQTLAGFNARHATVEKPAKAKPGKGSKAATKETAAEPGKDRPFGLHKPDPSG